MRRRAAAPGVVRTARFNSRREAIAEAFRKAGPRAARGRLRRRPQQAARGDGGPGQAQPQRNTSERPARREGAGRPRTVRQRVEIAAGARPRRRRLRSGSSPASRRVYVSRAARERAYRGAAQKRMRDQAKAGRWHTAPESVRGEVHRMHREFREARISGCGGDVEGNAAVATVSLTSRASETTLHGAVDNYVGIESKLCARTR